MPASNRHGVHEPMTFDAEQGWRAVGSLYATFDGEAVVEVRIRGARPYHLE